MSVRILHGDALSMLRTLPSESVQCVVTSPPYFALRDYGVAGQIGLEPTPSMFIEHLVAVFDEVKRVLRPDGLCFVNLGDSYSGSGKGPTVHNGIGDQEERQGFTGGRGATSLFVTRGDDPEFYNEQRRSPSVPRIPAKNLLLIPERFAIAMQEAGWYVRSRIAWCKTSAMPESVRDRPTSAWEHIWMFSKSARYFWDAEAVRQPWSDERNGASGARVSKFADPGAKRGDGGVTSAPQVSGANLRNVWTLGPEPQGAFTWPERVSVSVDDADDDTERTTSPDCPVHAGHRVATSRCGEPLAAPQTSTPHNGTGHVQAPLGGLSPTAAPSSVEPAPAPSSGDHAATLHSTPSSRTAPHAATNPACSASAGTPSHTGGTSTPLADGSPHLGTIASSTSGQASTDPRDSRSLVRTADREPLAARTVSVGLHDAVHTDASSTSAGSASSERRSGPSVRTVPSSTDKSTCTCSYSKVIIRESSHFASFPTEIPRRCILAGTSAKGACSVCGAGWVRQTERIKHGERVKNHRLLPALKDTGNHGTAGFDGNGMRYDTDYRLETRTLGWEQACKCDAGDPVPCVVLDPFGGSGTTGMVANRLGRDAVLIELSEKYVDIMRRRLENDAGPMFADGVEVVS